MLLKTKGYFGRRNYKNSWVML